MIFPVLIDLIFTEGDTFVLGPGWPPFLFFFPLFFFVFGGLVISDEGGLLEFVEFFSSEAIFFACSSILALNSHSLSTTGSWPAR